MSRSLHKGATLRYILLLGLIQAKTSASSIFGPLTK
jgi:hypothetical protein